MSLPRLWTKEEDEKLRALWTAGETASQIGLKVNRTRNAVIGRAHRLHLIPRSSPLGSTEFVDAINEEKTVWKIDFSPVDRCMWPMEKGLFCGKAVVAKKPYCAGHCKVAYLKNEVKRPVDKQHSATPGNGYGRKFVFSALT